MAARGGGTSQRGGRGGRSAPSQSSSGCLIWLVVFSFIFVLFVVNWGTITKTLERTNFDEILRSKDAGKGATEAPAKSAPRVDETLRPGSQTQPPSDAAIEPSARGAKPAETSPSAGAEKALSGAKSEGSGSGSGSGQGVAGSGAAAAGNGVAQPAAQAPAKQRAATLYFVRIDDDGVIVRQDVTRLIPTSDSPLSDALEALIKGPDASELNRRLISLIPAGTRLLSVRVQGTTALVNLSEPFMYNHYGIEGYAGQLKQIVYTATSFATVHDVQILIEGERHDYLGGEGVYIGKPLSRNSF